MPADLQIALLLTVRSRKQSSSYGRKVVLQTIRLPPNLQESYVEVGGSARPGPVTINQGGRKASAEVKVHETRGLVGAWRLTFRNASTALTLVLYGRPWRNLVQYNATEASGARSWPQLVEISLLGRRYAVRVGRRHQIRLKIMGRGVARSLMQVTSSFIFLACMRSGSAVPQGFAL